MYDPEKRYTDEELDAYEAQPLSEQDSDPLPPLPTGEQLEQERREEANSDEEFLKGDEWLGVDVEPYRLDFTKEYSAPRFVLSFNGVGFAPLGGIHAVTGQAGNGKTMLLAQFIAAILGGEFGSLRYELTTTHPEPRVLYIDTEMEEANTIAMKNRVLSMVGRVVGENYDDFVVLCLREVSSKGDKVPASVMRWRMVLKALYTYRPTVCFIDGLLDVVGDFNANVECAEIIYKCMQAATHYDISLWCLVHQNPGADKLVGHLGSMLERKVTDIFVAKKEKNQFTGQAVFNVRQLKARGRDVEDWQFQVLPVNGWGMPEQLTKQPLNNDQPEDIRKWLTAGRLDITWPATVNEIKGLLRTRGDQKNNDKLQADIVVARNRRFIIPQPDSEKTKGQKYPKFYLNPEEINITEPSDECPF